MSKQPLLKPKPQLNNFDIDEIVLQDCLDKHNPKLGKTLGLVLDQKARTAKKLWLFPNGKKFIVAGSKALGMDAGELTMDDLEMFASENVIGNVRETYKKIDNFQKRFSGADGKQLLRRMLDAVYDRSFSEAIDLKKLIDTGQFSEDSLLAFLTDFDNAAYFAVNQPEVLDQIIKSIDSSLGLGRLMINTKSLWRGLKKSVCPRLQISSLRKTARVIVLNVKSWKRKKRLGRLI